VEGKENLCRTRKSHLGDSKKINFEHRGGRAGVDTLNDFPRKDVWGEREQKGKGDENFGGPESG